MYIKQVCLQVEMKGLTGTIKFDQHGLRTDFSLEVVELRKEGLSKVVTIASVIEISRIEILNIV